MKSLKLFFKGRHIFEIRHEKLLVTVTVLFIGFLLVSCGQTTVSQTTVSQTTVSQTQTTSSPSASILPESTLTSVYPPTATTMASSTTAPPITSSNPVVTSIPQESTLPITTPPAPLPISSNTPPSPATTSSPIVTSIPQESTLTIATPPSPTTVSSTTPPPPGTTSSPVASPLSTETTLTITTTSLPKGGYTLDYAEVAKDWARTLEASGGSGVYTWSVPATGNRALPPGLSLDPSTGIITGTPTQVGIYWVDFTVTDSTGTTATKTIQMVIVNPADCNA